MLKPLLDLMASSRLMVLYDKDTQNDFKSFEIEKRLKD